MAPFSLPQLPSFPSLQTINTFPSLNNLANLLDPCPQVVYPAKSKSSHLQTPSAGKRSDGVKGGSRANDGSRLVTSVNVDTESPRTRRMSTSSQGPRSDQDVWRLVHNPLNANGRRGSNASTHSFDIDRRAADGSDETTPRPRHSFERYQSSPQRHRALLGPDSSPTTSPSRPLHRRTKSALPGPLESLGADRQSLSRSGAYQGDHSTFAFPPLPQPSNRLTEYYRNPLANSSAVSLPTLVESDGHTVDEVDAEELRGRTPMVQRAGGGRHSRIRRGSMSISVPPSRTLSFTSISSSSSRPGLSRADSSSSNESQNRRPMSPLSICSNLGSSIGSDSAMSDSYMPELEDYHSSVPLPQKQMFERPFYHRPAISPHGSSTANLLKRSRTGSINSITSIGEVQIGKGSVGEASTTDIAVMATWTFDNVAGKDQGRGTVRARTTGLRQRLANLQKLDTTNLEVTMGDVPGEDGGSALYTPTEDKPWRPPRAEQDIEKGRTRTISMPKPLFRVSLLAPPSARADPTARPSARRARPAYMQHRHTHSTPALLHPGYVSPDRVTGSPDRARPTKQRQTSRLREPAPLGSHVVALSCSRMADSGAVTRPASRGSTSSLLSSSGRCEMIESSMNASTAACSGMKRSSSLVAHMHAEGPSGEIEKVDKARWWNRRNSISGMLPPPVDCRARGSGTTLDLVMDAATDTLQSLDLARTGIQSRAGSPDSEEEFIDFEDM